jgi:peptidoglycan/LPS O-acetylase OafA/YrhL
MNTHSSKSNSGFLQLTRFRSLDGLRAFGILAVIWRHATGVGQGYLGVELFFAISGFLITSLLLREQRQQGHISLSKFYARRSLRIFPLYYAVLGIYILTVFATRRHIPSGQEFFFNLRYFLTYTSNWFVPQNWGVIFYFAWSLATEEQFYLVVPSLQKYLRSYAVLVIIVAVVIHLLGEKWHLGIVIAKISTPLCFGVLAAYALDDERSYRILSVVSNPKISTLIWFILVILFAWTGAQEVVLAVAMTCLVVSSSIRPDHAMAWLFDWDPLQSIGRVSYGMYMWHQLCLNLLRSSAHLSGISLFVVGSIFSYAIALISYRWYESYFLRMKSRYSVESGVREEEVPTPLRPLLT